MEKSFSRQEKPDLLKHLIWEFRYDQIDWKEEYLTIIEWIA